MSVLIVAICAALPVFIALLCIGSLVLRKKKVTR